jgi:2-keto-4-pentenoate hydratase/2-oxohepta-3-ene-1,7-dioic acid hydratase in catechol pathway
MRIARVEEDRAPRLLHLEPSDEVPASARLLPPVEPPSIRDFLTFEQHVEGMTKLHEPPRSIHPQWYEAPTFYFSNPHSLVGAHDDVAIPPGCTVFDFELEVAAVIGRDGRDLSPEDARDHILGYTIFNDWSARDLQFAEMQVGLGPAKGKDSAITLGPWLVTADELQQYRNGDRLDLELEVLVNGVRTGGDTLANMAWSFEELVAYASRGAWVRAGDVLGSGTCGGGCLAELWGRAGRREPRPLAIGDVVTMNVEGIGTISNRVAAGVDPVALPRARTRVEAA